MKRRRGSSPTVPVGLGAEELTGEVENLPTAQLFASETAADLH
ncbi:hypothetical protein [Verrucomicrobium sp. BvORR034]|nr:hypothetical protein [Verrucomicrobium sp. BvORR034]